jgi:signal transduction histidine kinase
MLDKSKMLRVLNNLVKNAIEAMPDGGKITIRLQDNNDQFTIKIEDTGVGIPKEKIDSIFRPFRSTKQQGMGLGLAFCKDTVEKHGGSISVTSKVGKGTTFEISLPKTHVSILDKYQTLNSENTNTISDSLHTNRS